jgi:hypothetical protein
MILVCLLRISLPPSPPAPTPTPKIGPIVWLLLVAVFNLLERWAFSTGQITATLGLAANRRRVKKKSGEYFHLFESVRDNNQKKKKKKKNKKKKKGQR